MPCLVERVVFKPWMLSESGVARPARCVGGERGRGGGGPGLSDIVSRWLAASSLECRRNYCIVFRKSSSSCFKDLM